MTSAAYKDALTIDRATSERYYASSLQRKTEQQKAMESLLGNFCPETIADIACGGGGATFHLGSMYPRARFTLVDYNEDALKVARKATSALNARCISGDVYNLPLAADSFDLAICWQTLSWIDAPGRALSELIRICRPGGRILASSLFNLTHDVDILSRVIDHTRPSGARSLAYTYNTYSLPTVERWVDGRAEMQVHPFDIAIDLKHEERGLGTYTALQADGRRVQLSAGMLLNWGILELHKPC